MVKFATIALAATLLSAPLAFAQSATTAPAASATAAPATPPPPPILDGAALLGPFPAPGTAAAAADTLAMRPQVSPERLALARQDQAFSPWVEMKPVLGDQFTEAHFPATARVFTDLLNGINPVLISAKTAYRRGRPYGVDHNVLQCDDPGPDNGISPSYPSGHAGMGWGWALALAELIPSKADAILQRGYDFGQSRLICGFHYPSDIAAGRLAASAVMARLHADPNFVRDMAAAKRELARAYH